MSSILETIAAEIGPETLARIGGAVGANPAQTQSVFAAALPALVGGLAKNASHPGGAASLASALDRDHGPNLVDSLGSIAGSLLGGGGASGVAALAGGLLGGGGGGLGSLLGALAGGGAPSSMPKALQGASILGHIFGGAPKTEGAAGSVASASGVDVGTVMKLLPLLAPIVMSALGTIKKKDGLDAGGVTSLLQSEAASLEAPSPPDAGFGASDLLKVGQALASSGVLGKLFG